LKFLEYHFKFDYRTRERDLDSKIPIPVFMPENGVEITNDFFVQFIAYILTLFSISLAKTSSELKSPWWTVMKKLRAMAN
jgi:hypothetical protein